MTAFLEALQAVSTIAILMVVGFILQKTGKIDEKISGFISFFVVNITLPCSAFKNITTSLTKESIHEIPLYVISIIVSQLLSVGAAYLMVKLFKINDDIKGSFMALTAFNNTIFMGLPVNVALFGEESTLIVLYYYVASMILFWTLGIKLIAGKNKTAKVKLPPTIYVIAFSFLVVLLMSYTNFEIPSFVSKTTSNFAAMTTPLSMIYTGYALGNFGIKNIRFKRSVSLGLIARFIVSPAIFLVIVSLLPISSLAKNVFTVQAFMPVMASQTIIARRYNVDDQYPAVMVAISTLLSLIIIPLVKVFVV